MNFHHESFNKLLRLIHIHADGYGSDPHMEEFLLDWSVVTVVLRRIIHTVRKGGQIPVAKNGCLLEPFSGHGPILGQESKSISVYENKP